MHHTLCKMLAVRGCSSLLPNIFKIKLRYFSSKPAAKPAVEPNHIVYDVYKPEDFEGVKEVFNESFFHNEPICRATGFHLPANEAARSELTALCAHALLDGCSLVARDSRTNTIVGHAVNKVEQLRDADGRSFFDRHRDLGCSTASAQAFMDFMVRIDAAFDPFVEHRADCLFEVMFLGTRPGFERAGIARELAERSLALARQLSRGELPELLPEAVRRAGSVPQVMLGVATSPQARRINELFGMRLRAEVPFSEAWMEGRSLGEGAEGTNKVVSVLTMEL